MKMMVNTWLVRVRGKAYLVGTWVLMMRWKIVRLDRLVLIWDRLLCLVVGICSIGGVWMGVRILRWKVVARLRLARNMVG